MEPESSLPYSQVPTNSPHPEPTPSSPNNPLPLPEDPYLYIYKNCINMNIRT
jgi:hypothetical protein